MNKVWTMTNKETAYRGQFLRMEGDNRGKTELEPYP